MNFRRILATEYAGLFPVRAGGDIAGGAAAAPEVAADIGDSHAGAKLEGEGRSLQHGVVAAAIAPAKNAAPAGAKLAEGQGLGRGGGAGLVLGEEVAFQMSHVGT